MMNDEVKGGMRNDEVKARMENDDTSSFNIHNSSFSSERLGVSPPCRLHRRPAPRSPQLAANRRSAGVCFELNSTSGFRDPQRWTRRADAQPLAECSWSHAICRNAAQCESLGHRPRYSEIRNQKALKGRHVDASLVPPLWGFCNSLRTNPGRCPGLSHFVPLARNALCSTSTPASGGRQPSGTLRFRPFRQIESQRTGKLTHAAHQDTGKVPVKVRPAGACLRRAVIITRRFLISPSGHHAARPHGAVIPLIIALRRQAPQWQRAFAVRWPGHDHRSTGTSPIVAENCGSGVGIV